MDAERVAYRINNNVLGNVDIVVQVNSGINRTEGAIKDSENMMLSTLKSASAMRLATPDCLPHVTKFDVLTFVLIIGLVPNERIRNFQKPHKDSCM